MALDIPENKAVHMALEDDLNWCGRATKHGHVVYIAGEDIEDVAQRYSAWKKHHGVERVPNLHFYKCPIKLDTDTPRFMRALEKKYGNIDVKMIFVDTLAVCSMGLEENSKREFDGVLGALEQMWRAFNCCVVAVHHAGKNGEMRGTSSMDGIAYSMIEVSQEDENIKLRSEKKRRGKKFAPFYLNMETVELPGLDEIGNQITSCVVTPSDWKEESDAERLTNFQRRVIDIIVALGGKRVAKSDVAKELGIDARDQKLRRAVEAIIKKELNMCH